MVPQRRPTTSSPTPPARETFTWPPPTDELDAIEVIVLDNPHAARRTLPQTRKLDLAHWGLTLTSLLAIVVALALQFLDWRGTTGAGQSSTALSASSTSAAASASSDDRGAALALAAPALGQAATNEPVAIDRVATAPPARRVAVRPAAFVPIRKSRARESQSRATIDSPPLRLPETYVQPRLVSSADGGRVRGKVVLGVQVRANGRVGAVDVLSDDGEGDRDLERAAVAAVKQWRYRPALRDGVPTPARLKVIVKFS